MCDESSVMTSRIRTFPTLPYLAVSDEGNRVSPDCQPIGIDLRGQVSAGGVVALTNE